MSRNTCHKPLTLPDKPILRIPCRRCPACVKTTRDEWVNRMKLEAVGKRRPFFITWTFSEDNYHDTPSYVLDEIQKLFKRLRFKGYDLRFFSCIERGSKYNRLHGHTILWSEKLSDLSFEQRSLVLRKAWGLGAIDIQTVKTPGALRYITKYMSKTLHENLDKKTGEVRKRRNYSWSRKPMLGMSGRKYWSDAIDYWVKQSKELGKVAFNENHLPPNYIKPNIMGKQDIVYIPKTDWIKKCKQLDIDLSPEKILQLSDKHLSEVINNQQREFGSYDMKEFAHNWELNQKDQF